MNKRFWLFGIMLLTAAAFGNAIDLWNRDYTSNTTFPTYFGDLINVTSLKIRNTDVCLSDGTNCPTQLNNTGNGSVRSITAGSGLSGGTITTTGTIAVIENGSKFSCNNITGSASGSLCQSFLTFFTEVDPIFSSNVSDIWAKLATLRADNTTQATLINNLDARESANNITQEGLISSLTTKQSADNTTLTSLIATKATAGTTQCSAGNYLSNITTNGGVTGICSVPQGVDNSSKLANNDQRFNETTLIIGINNTHTANNITLSGWITNLFTNDSNIFARFSNDNITQAALINTLNASVAIVNGTQRADNITLTSAIAGKAGTFTCSVAGTVMNSTSNCVAVTYTIASGTAALTTAALAATSCGTTVTVAATGVATTDSIDWAFNTNPAAQYGNVTVLAWVTSGNVNFKVCNPTAASRTPAAQTVNWRVTR